MEIIHNLGVLSLKKSVNEDAGFLLTNRVGGYCSLFSSPSSRYHGLFCFDKKTMKMYKVIESIELAEKNEVSSLKNGFYFAERRKGDVVECFTMPAGFDSLIYELSSENEIDLVLDCKDSYDNRESGRYYDIFEEDGCTIAKFTKKTDAKEDSSHDVEEFALYLAVKGSKGPIQKNGMWVERHYLADEQRNSPPFKRHVYSAARLKGTRFVFSVSKRKNDAIKECEHVFSNAEEIKKAEKKHFFDLLKKKQIKKTISDDKISKEIRVAYINACNSLSNLIVGNGNGEIFAGLPWFFQFWARDTLVSIKAMSRINKDFAKKMLFGSLNRINADGRLPSVIGQRQSKNLGSADAHGWLFLRCREFADQISKSKEAINSIRESIEAIKGNASKNQSVNDCIKRFSLTIGKKEESYHKLLYEIESSLEKSFDGLIKFHTKGSFETNAKSETWMDTEFEGDLRDGARIEIQALRLSMYRLMLELTQNHKYKAMENLLKNKIRGNFWNGKILADGLNDSTVRPNFFIAAYAYPDLLSKKEWEICFENALKALWLDWGGLSTIDKNSLLFTDESTGEDIKSYHHGDSWFWINDLAALTLNKISKTKFKNQIRKIVDASTEEILWKGCIGCHSELSSARGLSSKGCFNQAWSNAMFIEMIDECF